MSKSFFGEQMIRYYVDWSSWFSTRAGLERGYNIKEISNAVKRGGGHNIRTSNLHGWRNQPSVVTFSAVPRSVDGIRKEIERTVGTQWIIVREKDW